MPTTQTLDLARPYPLDDQQIQQFQRDGFIKLKAVLSAETLGHCGRAIDRNVQAHAQQHALDWDKRNTYQKAFVQVMNLWREDATVRELVFAKRLASLAARLLGCEGVRLYHDQALYKEPTQDTGGHTPWHVDQYYWPIDTPNTITAWIPLDAVPIESGPLAFAPCSQNFQSGRNMEISDDSENAIEEALKNAGYGLVAEPFDLGEVSFHYGWCFHRAEPNRGPSTRRVMTVIYMDQDARVIEPQNKDQANDLASWLPGLKAGDPAASPLNPVLWEKKGDRQAGN